MKYHSVEDIGYWAIDLSEIKTGEETTFLESTRVIPDTS